MKGQHGSSPYGHFVDGNLDPSDKLSRHMTNHADTTNVMLMNNEIPPELTPNISRLVTFILFNSEVLIVFHSHNL